MSDDLTLPDPADRICICLDIGTKYTGVSVWDRGKLVTADTVLTADGATARTAVAVFSAVSSYIKRAVSHKAADVLLVVEDYSYGGGFFNTHQAETVGLMKDFVVERGWAMVFVSAGTVKKAVTGSGKATKAEVKRGVASLGYKVKTSHEADSIGLFVAYSTVWKTPTDAMFRRSILPN